MSIALLAITKKKKKKIKTDLEQIAILLCT